VGCNGKGDAVTDCGVLRVEVGTVDGEDAVSGDGSVSIADSEGGMKLEETFGVERGLGGNVEGGFGETAMGNGKLDCEKERKEEIGFACTAEKS
jgi:hypothetical protein